MSGQAGQAGQEVSGGARHRQPHRQPGDRLHTAYSSVERWGGGGAGGGGDRIRKTATGGGPANRRRAGPPRDRRLPTTTKDVTLGCMRAVLRPGIMSCLGISNVATHTIQLAKSCSQKNNLVVKMQKSCVIEIALFNLLNSASEHFNSFVYF